MRRHAVSFLLSLALPAQATPSVSPSPTPGPTAAAGQTATPVYTVPTQTATPSSTSATPTPGPPIFPGMARLAPDLSLVRKRLRPDAKGRIKLSLRCKQVTVGISPATCDGRVRIIFSQAGRKRLAATKRFSFGAAQVGLVTVKLNRRARIRLKGGSRRAVVVANVGKRKAQRRVNLKRPR